MDVESLVLRGRFALSDIGDLWAEQDSLAPSHYDQKLCFLGLIVGFHYDQA